MQYRSTRGHPDRPGFASVLLEGLAHDGGLYVPESWPQIDLSGTTNYASVAARVMAPFVAPDPLEAELPAICQEAYASFRHKDVAPITGLGDGRFLLELHWGPTLSFKDYALAVVGRLCDRLLRRTGGRIVVLGATSGDTGSAAIDAFRGRDNIDVVILFPEGRVSEIQRRQMTTVLDRNVTTVAVSGTFDDCQALVKRAFADPDVRLPLTAFNSINWGRVMAQAAYYMWTAQRTRIPGLGFAVPTGNFGNVFSGLVAKRCGASIGRLIIANNENHGLTDLIESGRLELKTVRQTVAPAMDIQLPSNLERYLFDLSSGDTSQVERWQEDLSTKGRLELAPELHEQIRQEFAAGWVDDRSVEDLIFQVYDLWRIVVDPHTAIAWGVGERLRRPAESLVTISTAHPAKFPQVVKEALGFEPEVPPDLADLAQRPERYEVIPNDYASLRNVLKRFNVDF